MSPTIIRNDVSNEISISFLFRNGISIDWPAGDNNKDYRPIVGLSKTKTS